MFIIVERLADLEFDPKVIAVMLRRLYQIPNRSLTSLELVISTLVTETSEEEISIYEVATIMHSFTTLLMIFRFPTIKSNNIVGRYRYEDFLIVILVFPYNSPLVIVFLHIRVKDVYLVRHLLTTGVGGIRKGRRAWIDLDYGVRPIFPKCSSGDLIQ